jgi:hypothetical protein
MTPTSWNAGIEFGKTYPTFSAGQAWSKFLETSDAQEMFLNFTVEDEQNARKNFIHAFMLSRTRTITGSNPQA